MKLRNLKMVGVILLVLLGVLGGGTASAATQTFTLDTTKVFVPTGPQSTGLTHGGNACKIIGMPLATSLELSFTGTGVTINWWAGGSGNAGLYLSIDGGAYALFNVAKTGSWPASPTTLATGLTEGVHTISLWIPANQQMYTDAVNTLVVTGAAPALNNAFALSSPLQQIPFQTMLAGNYMALEGDQTANVAGAINYQDTTCSFYNRNSAYKMQTYRFKGSLTAVGVYTYNPSNRGIHHSVSVDGVAYPTYDSTTMPAGTSQQGSHGLVMLAKGLDISDGRTHEYVIYTDEPNESILAYAGTLSTTALTTRPIVALYGDSITALAGSGPVETYGRYLADALGMQWGNRGITGTVVESVGGAYAGVNRTADITGLSPAPPVVVIEYGTNDMSSDGNGNGGTYTTAGLTTDYTTMLNRIHTGLPNAKIYCVGILPRGDGPTAAQITTWNAAIKAAVTGVDNANIVFIDPTGWIFPHVDPTASGPSQSQFASDNLHPVATGNQVIAQQLAKKILPSTTASRTGTHSWLGF